MLPPPSYRHVQVYAVIWLLAPTSTAAVLSGLFPGSSWVALLGSAIATVSLLGTVLVLGRLVIEIRGDQLHWHFGFLRWPRWQVALADILAVERTKADFWQGSGIKGRRDDRLYNVAIGGPALALRLRDGRRITLGTPEPERLAAFIEARLPR